ncbi:hypothetical protein R6Q59_021214 [Mikania micrantha]
MVALFSAALLLYYAVLKTNAYMIVSINCFGCLIEVVYLSLYLFYAPKSSKISTIKFISIFNVLGLGMVILVSMILVKGPSRVKLVGWICAIINLAVFAAPLAIMRKVIRTKSVEYMPFMLSFALTLCATAWFFYGFFVNDFYIADSNKQTGMDQAEKPDKITTDNEDIKVVVMVNNPSNGHQE